MRFLKPEHSAFHILITTHPCQIGYTAAPPLHCIRLHLGLPLRMSKDAPLPSLGCRMQREALIYSELLLQERGPPPPFRGGQELQIKSRCVHHPAKALPLTDITLPTTHVQIPNWGLHTTCHDTPG